MKLLKQIIKEILIEQKEPVINKGKKRITIELYDSSGDFERLIRWWESMGNIGHSALIHCDVDSENMVKLYCDGDGSDRVSVLDVEMLPDEE